MTTKNLIILAGVAVVLGGLATVTSRGSKPAAAKLNGKDIFPAFDASAVSRIEFGDKLKLAATDGGWKIESYFGYPADRTKIADNLLKLASLKVGQVARGKTLEKPVTLALKDASDKPVAELQLGEKHAKWGHGRYAAFAGETVLVSDTLDAFGDDAKAWCETKIVDEPWISFNAVVDPKEDAAAFGFATGVVAKVKIGSDTNRLVTVGGTVKGGSDRYLKINDQPWVYTVSSYSVESLVKPKEEPKPAEPAKVEATPAPKAEAKPAEAAKAEAKPAPAAKAEAKPTPAAKAEAKSVEKPSAKAETKPVETN